MYHQEWLRQCDGIDCISLLCWFLAPQMRVGQLHCRLDTYNLVSALSHRLLGYLRIGMHADASNGIAVIA